MAARVQGRGNSFGPVASVAADSLGESTEEQDPPELTTDEISMMAEAQQSDCNVNGIEDSLDVAWGFDDDRDHDGVLDICDRDAGPDSLHELEPGWRNAIGLPDSGFFQVRLRRNGTVHGARMRYVLRKGANVTLSVRNLPVTSSDLNTGAVREIPAGVVDTVFVRREHQVGAHELYWNREYRGRHAGSMFYEFTLRIGDKVYRRRLGWI